jgi:hypothetical protein
MLSEPTLLSALLVLNVRMVLLPMFVLASYFALLLLVVSVWCLTLLVFPVLTLPVGWAVGLTTKKEIKYPHNVNASA